MSQCRVCLFLCVSGCGAKASAWWWWCLTAKTLRNRTHDYTNIPGLPSQPLRGRPCPGWPLWWTSGSASGTLHCLTTNGPDRLSFVSLCLICAIHPQHTLVGRCWLAVCRLVCSHKSPDWDSSADGPVYPSVHPTCTCCPIWSATNNRNGGLPAFPARHAIAARSLAILLGGSWCEQVSRRNITSLLDKINYEG